jgi:Uma2 family endonuclease
VLVYQAVMSVPAQNPMDIEAFLAFAEKQERGRFELWRGELFAMAPERVEHVRAKFAISRALASPIEKVGFSSEAFVAGLSVGIDSDTVYEPDALVNSGEKIPAGSMLAPTPIVVVEVVSPNSSKRDTGLKVEGYFSVATIAHYLVVDLAKRVVLHYRREGEARIGVTILCDGALTLDPPGITVELAEFFR